MMAEISDNLQASQQKYNQDTDSLSLCDVQAPNEWDWKTENHNVEEQVG